jgi:hypothetical protein
MSDFIDNDLIPQQEVDKKAVVYTCYLIELAVKNGFLEIVEKAKSILTEEAYKEGEALAESGYKANVIELISVLDALFDEKLKVSKDDYAMVCYLIFKLSELGVEGLRTYLDNFAEEVVQDVEGAEEAA